MNEPIVTEFKNIRVLTTQQLADSYETNTDVISKNYSNNKERYEEGKHYVLLQGEELKEAKANGKIYGLPSNANKFYLWTEKGAFLHAKSLNTDKAWEVYDKLVDSYFKENEQKPKCIEDVLIESLQEMKAMRVKFAEQDKQIEYVEGKVEGIREIISLDTTSWRTDTQSLINKIAIFLGGGQEFSNIREESYKLLNLRMGVDVATRLTNMRRRMAEEGASVSKRNKMSYLDVISNDKKLIEGYVAIVKEMAIKYGVA